MTNIRPVIDRWGLIPMTKPHLRVVRPTTVNRPVMPTRAKNAELRTREHLTAHEVEKLFTSERGAPFAPTGFSRMVERAGIAADLGIKIHAHMLRHSTGFKLAKDGVDTRALQAYLGHRNIQNTTRYTALAPDRFKGFWRD